MRFSRHVLAGALTVVVLGTVFDLLFDHGMPAWGFLLVVLCGYAAMFASAALTDRGSCS